MIINQLPQYYHDVWHMVTLHTILDCSQVHISSQSACGYMWHINWRSKGRGEKRTKHKMDLR